MKRSIQFNKKILLQTENVLRDLKQIGKGVNPLKQENAETILCKIKQSLNYFKPVSIENLCTLMGFKPLSFHQQKKEITKKKLH